MPASMRQLWPCVSALAHINTLLLSSGFGNVRHRRRSAGENGACSRDGDAVSTAGCVVADIGVLLQAAAMYRQSES